MHYDDALDEDLNIALVTDKTFLFPSLVTFQSILDHLPQEKIVNFYILHTGLSLDQQKIFISVLADDARALVHFLDCKAFVSQQEAYRKLDHLSLQKSLMVFAPTILKDVPHLILLEGDMLVRDDISKLLTLAGNSPFAAVPNMWDLDREAADLQDDFDKYQLKFDASYFNGGLKVLNNQRITDHEREQLIALGSINERPYEELTYNRVFQDNIHLLPLRWNSLMEVSYSDRQPPSPKWKEQWEEAIKNPAICHYMASSKPWANKNVLFFDEYLDVWQRVKARLQKKLLEVMFPDPFK